MCPHQPHTNCYTMLSIRRRPHQHRNQATTTTTTTATRANSPTLAIFSGGEGHTGRGMGMSAEGVDVEWLGVKAVVADDEERVQRRVVLGMYSEEWQGNVRGTYNPGGPLHTSATATASVVFHSPCAPAHRRPLISKPIYYIFNIYYILYYLYSYDSTAFGIHVVTCSSMVI